MFENILKGLRGPWGVLAILVAATPTGRKYAKLAAREIVRAGIVATEKVKEVAAEIKEEGADIVAELQEERANELLTEGNHKKNRKEAANAKTADLLLARKSLSRIPDHSGVCGGSSTMMRLCLRRSSALKFA